MLSSWKRWIVRKKGCRRNQTICHPNVTLHHPSRAKRGRSDCEACHLPLESMACGRPARSVIPDKQHIQYTMKSEIILNWNNGLRLIGCVNLSHVAKGGETRAQFTQHFARTDVCMLRRKEGRKKRSALNACFGENDRHGGEAAAVAARLFPILSSWGEGQISGSQATAIATHWLSDCTRKRSHNDKGRYLNDVRSG